MKARIGVILSIILISLSFLVAFQYETGGLTLFIDRSEVSSWDPYTPSCKIKVSIGHQTATTRIYLKSMYLTVDGSYILFENNLPVISFPTEVILDSFKFTNQRIESNMSDLMSPLPLSDDSSGDSFFKSLTVEYDLAIRGAGGERICFQPDNDQRILLDIELCAEYTHMGVDSAYPCAKIAKLSSGDLNLVENFITKAQLDITRMIPNAEDIADPQADKWQNYTFEFPRFLPSQARPSNPPLDYPEIHGVYTSHLYGDMIELSTYGAYSCEYSHSYGTLGLPPSPCKYTGNNTNNNIKIQLPGPSSATNPSSASTTPNYTDYYTLLLYFNSGIISTRITYPRIYLVSICLLLDGYDIMSNITEDCKQTVATLDYLISTIAPLMKTCKTGYYSPQHFCSLPRSFGPYYDQLPDERSNANISDTTNVPYTTSVCRYRKIDENGKLSTIFLNQCPLWFRYVLTYTTPVQCETFVLASDSEIDPVLTQSPNGAYSIPANIAHFPTTLNKSYNYYPVEQTYAICRMPSFICISGNQVCYPGTRPDTMFTASDEANPLVLTPIQKNIRRYGFTYLLFRIKAEETNALEIQGRTINFQLLSQKGVLPEDNIVYLHATGSTTILFPGNLIAHHNPPILSLCDFYNSICIDNIDNPPSKIYQCTAKITNLSSNARLPSNRNEMCVCSSTRFNDNSDPLGYLYEHQSKYYYSGEGDDASSPLCRETSIATFNLDDDSTPDYPYFKTEYGENSHGQVILWNRSEINRVRNPDTISPIRFGIINTNAAYPNDTKYQLEIYISPIQEENTIGHEIKYAVLTEYTRNLELITDITVLENNTREYINVSKFINTIWGFDDDLKQYRQFIYTINLVSIDQREYVNIHDVHKIKRENVIYSQQYMFSIEDDIQRPEPCTDELCHSVKGGAYCSKTSHRCECNDWTLSYTPKGQCMPPCPCMNGGTCRYPSPSSTNILDSLEYTCQCQTGYEGPLCQLRVEKPYIPPPPCVLSQFNPRVCVMGMVTCPTSPLTDNNEPYCKCQQYWSTSQHHVNDSNEYCSLCNLDDTDNNPDNRCDPTGTHPVSYTRERCGTQKCVCRRGYTGDRCQYSALYADMTFISPTNNDDDDNNNNNSTTIINFDDYRSNLLTYIRDTLSILPHHDDDPATSHPIPIYPFKDLDDTQLSEYIRIYKTLTIYKDIDDDDGTTPQPQPIRVPLKYTATFIFNVDMITQLVNGNINGSPYHLQGLSNYHVLDNATTLQSIYDGWVDIVDDINTDPITDQLGQTDQDNSHVYDVEKCSSQYDNNIDDDGNTTIDPTCPVDDPYRDNDYDDEWRKSNGLDFLAPPRERASTSKAVGSVIGIVVGCCMAFVILMIVIIWAKKTKRLCFAPRKKRDANNSTTDTDNNTISKDNKSKKNKNTKLASNPSETVSYDVEMASGTGTKTTPTSSPPEYETTTMPTPVPGNDGEHLPTGWSKVRDPATGKKYYLNDLTLETSWNPPNADGTRQTETSDLGW